MATKHDVTDWVVAALKRLGGRGSLVKVAEEIWKHHESELRSSGDLFYTWQYDMRWAATELRKRGLMVAAADDRRGKWTLK